MGKAQKKTGKGRLDKYYKLAKYVVFTLSESHQLMYVQRARLPSSFGIQAHSTEQEIQLSRVGTMLYRPVCRAWWLASGRE